MSKTYKHQRKFDAKKYWENKSIWEVFTGPKDINEPEYDGMHVEIRRKKWIERDLWRKYRHTVKKMIHLEEYDLLPKKPDDSSWIIW